ncbi:MAG: DUF3990 domain-containing protein [Ruminococcus sp.]|nr:DUF3990 domain-containing protein [Ruminococcus sp.]
MIIYHGSNVIVENPRIITSEAGRDFGFGFYTTDIKDQAIRWAKRRARLVQRTIGQYTPYISVYEFDESAYSELKCIHYPEPTMDWLNMICKCRSNPNYVHGYDIVTGKIANDNVGETVTYVLRNIMRKEDAVERLRFEKINNQICFNTENALSYLTFIGYEDCR